MLVLSLKPSPDELDRLARLGRPVTIVGADMPGWATVRIDDHEAAATATRHLIDLGHRRIAYIGGATEGVLDFTAPSARLAGYRCTLEQAGLAAAARARGGRRVHRRRRPARRPGAARDRPDRPTAIFAASDEMAIGVLRAARELGLRVPEDVSVIGIDDHEMAELLRPDHGRPAGARAGPGRGDPGARRARATRTGARSR